MRSEKEIREYRKEMYRCSILAKQQESALADLFLIFVNEIDWVLGEKEHGDYDSVARLFDHRDKDSKKLALF